ncbi:glycosyltransferase [Maribellus sp. YY47]|uniref:glycosyltransferase family 2 protein n=1 Tax=Maribellus sp. YY47 TaxID=2929486 RepID=UPI0020017423|nr:glycosyltransferase [Maribellus sp. YY47]MCK3683022.1 glycosyltransferase family 2 protein [Maribellus sp. YY47]
MSTIKTIIELLFLLYTVCILSFYFWLAIVSAKELIKNVREAKTTNFDALLSSPFAPVISVLAPAYNESLTIVDNIRALLGLYYPNFEIIVINDGSKDDSLEKTIKAFDMELVPFATDYKIKCQPIRGIYKSKVKAFSNLTVIDKLNGGKADALNAGINISKGDYFISIDVDSIIDPHALKKLIKPFFEETDKRVIAAGGVIQIANSCVIENGQMVEVNVPDKFLPRCQVIEYSRAFLMGRLAWSRLDGLLLISGALGLFDKEVVINCGGYYTKTVGEDMELVVRMRKYMADNNQKYKVVYISDPLCWTEAPSTLKVLGSQRNRWTRGTIDTIMLHRNIFFNRKYGFMGMVSHPYWVFFEWLAPIIEFSGILYFIIIALMGWASWSFFYVMLGFVYFFAIMFSNYAILFDHLSYNRYKKKRMIFKLLLTAWIEPFFYHPFVVYWGLRGNFDYFIKKKKSWGKMTRSGFEMPKYKKTKR